MLGKASEIKTAIIDVRELNDWLEKYQNDFIIDMQFCMVDTSHAGVLPQVLIIYKEGESA